MSFDEIIVWCQGNPDTAVARLLELTRQIAELESASQQDSALVSETELTNRQETLSSLWTEVGDLASKDDAS